MTDVLKIVNWFRAVSNAQMRQYGDDELSQMKVMKLLYYVQGTFLAVYGRQAFADDILAWRYGPVVKAVHDKYAGRVSIVGQLTAADLADYNELERDPELQQVLTAVWTAFGDMSAIQLMKGTHQERPWQETPQSQVIAPALMAEYFKASIVQ
ncbi:Panacea domain-containing protein [Levilactobacillus angrenensis]|uniref:Panacea domain-containing protein n=1 Tax=Levilactobacillus angrenensis TaxID=2486020 RepID=A0ABW1U8Q0_9LACO|nr:type II toxin-antitoxin system antitoxin SocA domain-containing protein [Levilactobacillus angrenensis]